MQKIKAKRISVMISFMLVLTMLFGTGSVLANGNPGENELRSIYVTQNYVRVENSYEAHVDVIACFKLDAGVVTNYCEWTVDHTNVIDVNNGVIHAKEKGVATITVKYGGLNAQVVVEVI